MARRRKGDAKPPAKTTTPEKPAAVRKSRRQIAKKQQDKKVNGETTVRENRLNDSEELQPSSQESEPNTNSISLAQHKKFGKYRCPGDDSKEILTNDLNNVKDNQEIKSNAESSDSQEAADKISVDNDAEEVQQSIVEVDQAQNSDEVIWQEDVIEETIEICEEMEVEEDGVEGSYTISQEEGSVLLEEVLLVNNHDFEGEGVVEFTVIRNEDGTESMVVARDEETLSCKEYVAETLAKSVIASKKREENDAEEFKEIEKRVGNITVEENEPQTEEMEVKVPDVVEEVVSSPFSANLEEKDGFLSNNSKETNPDSRKDSTECKIFSGNKVQTKLGSVSADTCDKLDSGIPFLETQPSEASDDLKNENTQPDDFLSEKKTAQTEISVEKKPEDEISIDGVKNGADVGQGTGANVEESKEKGSEDIRNEESSGDSEVDTKADTEDIKVSSSSDNSNDTLLSSNSYKLPEFSDVKNIPNQQNEAEKKTGFRSRSGSTDTTGSESGSNSSGVRRSSRIRSIGLMKQRSRGRGLVTKPNLDLSRAIFHQDREKLNSVFSLDSKDNSDNQSETQSDKESSGVKNTGFFDSPAPLAALGGSAGYESDTSKPVKVKSRWRRSSELEMGGTAKAQTLSGESDASAENVSVLAGSPSADLALNIIKVNSAKAALPTLVEARDREMEERLSQFEHLRENLYLTERYTNKETKRMVCDCFLTDEEIARGELGCGEDCLNRLLMIECGPRCVVGERCTNKRFQNCEYAKCEVFRTDKKGFGLRAIVDLQSGEFLMEYVGEVVDPKDFRRRAKDYSKDKNRHYYFMALKSDQIIDATAKGNISRFINHSCDPNSETQKWTVNGELRIGFFNKQFIAAGEEITFDYHFQRYGKEAQKCYCEAENCRGWIGETPEEEKEKTEKKEKIEKDVKKKKEEKKSHDYMEDEDLEEEIEKLCSGGLKNRAHTLTLSRLMVRSRELEHRTRLLRLIQSGEQPCRRLFLDYHGLRLIWSYMMDIAANDSAEAQNFRLEILKTLNTLPIPNKTMLMDSKVFAVVEKWAKQVYSSPASGSPEDEDSSKPKINNEEPDSSCDVDSNEKIAAGDSQVKNSKDIDANNEVKPETEEEARAAEEQSEFTELANSLLCDWSNLKEVFRIPKKERIEQMKEHEREADRGYKEDLEKEDRRDKSYERSYRSDRYSRGEGDKQRSDRRRGRDSPDFEYRPKEKRTEERANLVPIPRMSKYERRQLFALKVAEEEKERQRRQQQETWQEHEARCLALGMDPHTTPAIDPQTGYPLFFNPSLGQWQHYPPIQDAADLSAQCPVYIGASQALPPHQQPGIMPPNPHMIPGGVPPPVFAQNPSTASFNPPYPLALAQGHHHESIFPDNQLQQIQGSLIPVQNGAPQEMSNIYTEKSIGDQNFADTGSEALNQSAVPPPPLDLPPKWKSARDQRGRIYFYNITERISQWLPPPPDHFGALQETSSSSESSEESSSSEEDDEDIEDEDGDEDFGLEEAGSAMDVDHNVGEGSVIILKGNIAEKIDPAALEDNVILISEPKKRRDGLVQERIISPRREEERVDHKKYKETKEKLRRQKEKSKLKDHVDKLKKHRRSSKAKSHSKHTLSKLQAITADQSTSVERKIKDTFRVNMANVMVHFLNPYRKNDCRQGRITNTEDFKHLARKLTHFVLAKELKHCKSVDELQCNENVKHKAKDFVRKYMSKFGAVYQKGSDED